MNYQIKNIVAFAILMENDQGVISKSPDYILEKFERYCLKQEDKHSWGLDGPNRIKLNEWIKLWNQ